MGHRAWTGAPIKNLEFYGTTWAQEIAHRFGRRLAGDAHGEMPPTDQNFPYAHGGIGEPGLGIGTGWWNGSPFVLDPGVPAGGSKHAHDFMSYGLPNDSQDHTFSWVSPYTSDGLRQAFEASARAPGYRKGRNVRGDRHLALIESTVVKDGVGQHVKVLVAGLPGD